MPPKQTTRGGKAGSGSRGNDRQKPYPTKDSGRDQTIDQIASQKSKKKFDEIKQDHEDFENGTPHGKDNPTPGLFAQARPAIFLTSDNVISELYGTDRDMKYRYDTFSCNPLLRISFGVKYDGTNALVWDPQSTPIESISIGSETIVAVSGQVSIIRTSILPAGLTIDNLRQQFTETFSITNITDEDVDKMVTFGKSRPKEDQQGLECFSFETRQQTTGSSTQLAIISPKQYTGTGHPQSKKILQQLNHGTRLTVIRQPDGRHRQVMDKFWDDRLEFCLDKGIYARYALLAMDPPATGDALIQRALEGSAKIQHLPWLQKDGKGDGMARYESHPAKTWFTSMQEYHDIFSIALLMELDYQRSFYLTVFDNKTSYDAHIERGHHGLLEFHISLPDEDRETIPKVPNHAEFVIRRKAGGPYQKAIEGHKIDTVTEKDFVILVNLSKDEAKSWEDEKIVEVALKMNFNIEPARRQLQAIEEMERTSKVASNLHRLLLGRDYDQASLQEHPPLINKRYDMSTDDQQILDDYTNTFPLNFHQWVAFDKTFDGKHKLNVIQGPPGTGKSAVNACIAIFAALMSLRVLATAPTNQAVKELARNIAIEYQKLPEGVQKRFKAMYNPTEDETIDRLLESLGYNRPTKAYSDPKDKIFEGFQMWHHLVEYVKKMAASGNEKATHWLSGRERMKQGKDFKSTALEQWKRFAKQWLGDIVKDDSVKVLLSTCNNSNRMLRQGIIFSLVLVDECAFDQEHDVLIPMLFKHDMLVLTGDHRQLRPIVTSRFVNDESAQLEMSIFERIVEHMKVPFTMLKRNYRMPPQIADLVGILGGYDGLACGENTLDDNDPIFVTFRDWWTSDANDLLRNSRRTPHDIGSHRIRRLFLNVDGKSAKADGTLSTVNYGNINAIVEFIQDLPKSVLPHVVVQSPYSGQQNEIVRQLELRVVSDSIISVKTVDSNQGGEAKLIILDLTVANWTDGGFLGFLRQWNRMNVALSRASQVLVIVGNIDLWRVHLESVRSQSEGWAMMIMDLIDQGDIIDYYATMGPHWHNLPTSKAELDLSPANWSLKSPESDDKHDSGRFKPQPRTQIGVSQPYTTLEQKVLLTLRNKRDSAQKAIVLAELQEAVEKEAWREGQEGEGAGKGEGEGEEVGDGKHDEEGDAMEEVMNGMDDLDREVAQNEG